MQRLNLPTYSFKIKHDGERQYIFDEIRRKHVVLTPEEWVRQNFARYLVHEKSCPSFLISIEQRFTYNKMSKRADILVHNRKGQPVMIVECKAPGVRITQKAFDQIALYNLQFSLNYLVVTNGRNHFCCFLEPGSGSYSYLKEIPDYSLMTGDPQS